MAESSSGESSLDDILSRCGLEKEDLEQKCSNDVILEISESLGEDWELTGRYLGFTRSQIKDIKTENNTGALRRLTMLEDWEEREGEGATCLKLAEALHRRKRTDLVEAICQSINAAKSGALHSKSKSEPARTKRLSRDGKREPIRTESPTGMAQSRNEDEIKGHFSSLLIKMRNSLDSHKIEVKDLRQFLRTFFNTDEEILKSNDIDEILATLKKHNYWSHLNYGPLETLSKHFLEDDSEVNDLLEDYKSRVTCFELSAKLIEYVKEKNLTSDTDVDYEQPATGFTPSHYKKIKVVVRVTRKVTEVSLQYVQNLWKSIADEFDIPSLTAIISHISPGSLHITWSVPPYWADLIKPTSKFCRQHMITIIAIDDQVIYDEEQMVGYEQQFDSLCYEGSACIGDFADLVRLGVDPNIHDQNGCHPLMLASRYGRRDLIELLINHGAIVDLPMHDEVADTALHVASGKGHVEVMTILVQRGANVNSLNKNGVTPLYYASEGGSVKAVHLLVDSGALINEGKVKPLWIASNGRPEVVEALLDRSADINLTNEDEYGNTALHAASKGHVEVMAILVQRGANVNSLNKNGVTPLYYASESGSVKAVHLLVDSGALINEGKAKPLWSASYDGIPEVVEALLDRGADINLTNEDEIGETALHAASGEGHVEVMTILVQRGANVNSLNKYGVTPLYYASESGSVKAVHLLIDSGALINEGKRKPMWSASYNGRPEVVEVLLDRGADIQLIIEDEVGDTALHAASGEGHVEVMTILVQRGANVNSLNKNGVTPLYYASESGSVKAVHLLVDSGALINEGKRRPLWSASSNGIPEVVEALLERGADINLTNEDEFGNTALHAASHKGHLEVMTILVQRGAKVNSLNKKGLTPLYYACLGGSIKAVRLLVDSGALVNEGGDKPLWIASKDGRPEIVGALLDRGADINITSEDEIGETALHAASGEGHVEVMTVLVQRGAKVNFLNKNGETPLYYASNCRSVKAVHLLLDSGALINEGEFKPLWIASYDGKSEVVEVLLDRGADINLISEDEFGDTALHAASDKGHVEVMTILVQRGANVNSLNKNGLTPLHYASESGCIKAVHLLVDSGALVNEGKIKPLWIASYNSTPEVVEALLDRGADINLTNEDEIGNTALHAASHKGHVEVMTILVQRGAKVNSLNKMQQTPLLAACDEGRIDSVKLLLQHNVHLEDKNNEGRTALLVACLKGYFHIVRQLLQAGAKPNVQDQNGFTPLIVATQNGHADIITALLEAKADPNITEKASGWTALFIASKEGNVEIVQLLITRGASVDLKDKNGVTAYDVAKLHGHQAVCDELKHHIKPETKTEITEDQKEQVKTSSKMFKAVIDLLERTLLKERAEKKKKKMMDKQKLRKESRIYDIMKSRFEDRQQAEFTHERRQRMNLKRGELSKESNQQEILLQKGRKRHQKRKLKKGTPVTHTEQYSIV